MAWLGFMLVAALRRRGREEVPSNLAPGTTDDELETRRLEGAQKTAVILSAFLAVSLPLYFLGEQARQDSFTGQFHDESVARGEALVTQYQCFSACHGPEGVGGAAPYVEKRSGISVLWTAPSLNDVFYRYSEDEVTFWVTYGRGNTPMPAWGLAGGGPLNESQVQDVVNYLKTIQVSQEESVAKFENQYRAEQAKRLENATQTAEEALVKQQQVLADINAAPDKAPIVSDFATRARSLLDNAGQGIDTDGDGLSDTTETGLVDLGNELVDTLRVMDPVTLDPQNPTSVDGVDDLTTATSALDRLDELVTSGQEPILVTQRDAVAQALDQGVVDPVIGLSPAAIDTLSTIADQASSLGVAPPRGDLDLSSATTFVQALEDAASAQGASADLQQAASDARAALDGGQDADGDGLSADAEKTISDQVQAAIAATTPSQVTVPNIDPTNPETSGEPDADVASNVVAGYENLALNLTVTTNNLDKQVTGAQKGVDFLQNALDQKRWQIDFQGVADSAFNGDVDKATRAVLLFNSYCARCHTAGFSAGVPYTLEAGSGGFGPALWKGREPIQFGPPADKPADDLLIQFITKGSEEQKPYGLNGFGSGRMPAFGEILTESDIELLAQYLRGGNLDGMGSQ